MEADDLYPERNGELNATGAKASVLISLAFHQVIRFSRWPPANLQRCEVP
jgi:hypothetical protein